VGIVSRPLTKWASRRDAQRCYSCPSSSCEGANLHPPLHAPMRLVFAVCESNHRTAHQSTKGQIEPKWKAGSHPLCHGQKQLPDRPSCWRNFCYQPNLYQAAIAAVYVCGVGPGSSVCPGSTAPTTHRPKCSFGALRRSRRLSCTSRRLCCERADICLYPICTKPRCAGVCLRGRTEGGPLRRYQSDSPNDMARLGRYGEAAGFYSSSRRLC